MDFALSHKGFTPRATQTAVIKAIDEAFTKYRYVILESPVGSGKSAIAMTLAQKYGTSHVLTPRKSLQDQYLKDGFQNTVAMKGRNGYPCLPRLDPLVKARRDGSDWDIPSPREDVNREFYIPVINLIREGKVLPTTKYTCDIGPCNSSKAIKKTCSTEERPCPYVAAMDTAEAADHVIHNIHSFFYQTTHSMRFAKRDLMVIDEAHDLEDVVRGFLIAGIRVTRMNAGMAGQAPLATDPVEKWIDWFLATENLSREILKNYAEEGAPLLDQLKGYYDGKGHWTSQTVKPNGVVEVHSTPQQRFSTALDKMEMIYSRYENDQYIVVEEYDDERAEIKYSFVPLVLKNHPENLFFCMGEKVLLMSGTIYDKDVFCRRLGIDPKDAMFLRVDSEFPAKRRPIILKKSLMTDNSFASWRDNPEEKEAMMENIKHIMDTYHDVKGLIHAPSYSLAQDIVGMLQDDRLVTHSPQDALKVINEFTNTDTGNTVLVSPICGQGVDFKYDIARFQMILRVPYLNASDPFINHMRRMSFPWYNLQSLIVFGQQIGRIMRSGDDWGHTYLLDSRFDSYLLRNARSIPKWVRDSIKRS